MLQYKYPFLHDLEKKERLMEMPRDFGVFLHCSQILICGLISIMAQNFQSLHWVRMRLKSAISMVRKFSHFFKFYNRWVHKSFSMYYYV